VKVVVLDSLFDTLDVETDAAAELGGAVEAWGGEPERLASAEVVAHVRTRVDSELIAAMHACRVIARFGTGLDTVDLEAAAEAGISVVGVRDYCLPELTSQTLMLAFALVRRLGETAGRLDATWATVARDTPLRRCARAVVVGYGSVGRRVAAALSALEFCVQVVTRHAVDDAVSEGFVVTSLDCAFSEAEIVFLTCALTEETRGLVDARKLRLLRPGAILVNTARLGLVDEAAVADALDAGTLGGLALDAALSLESPLRRFADDPRVLITPHLGWYSEQSAVELRRRAIADALSLAHELPARGVQA
jgi:D-3-phosphoglycerate dehydrogenase